ncbi:GntR family transcriptional regulator [Paracoccus sp. TK19116]|uniref:GntR family transcriptional regulator n=1 Tax=Paracoccus albicereus TaxID=2922394 RepID=A0ABT1MU17_9RHOB|nr:GntR family transcriptional regulator [Paracoccus albicereus]MCQ0971619.1 GntR family transcriptional regulator [Paracoccus albicereus]
MSINDKLKPIDETFTLKDYTYKALRAAILEIDIYQPDADLRLDERKVADRLGVSRTPIREALARLSHEGLVESVPRRGVFVRRKTREEVLDMVILWAALESMASRLACANATDKELESLRTYAMKHSVEADRADLQEYSDANIAFHQRILDLSGCKLLRSTADEMFAHMQAIRRRALRENDRARRSVVDHMGIIAALAERNADLAAERVLEHTMRLHDHISRTWYRWESRYQDQEDHD